MQTQEHVVVLHSRESPPLILIIPVIGAILSEVDQRAFSHSKERTKKGLQAYYTTVRGVAMENGADTTNIVYFILFNMRLEETVTKAHTKILNFNLQIIS